MTPLMDVKGLHWKVKRRHAGVRLRFASSPDLGSDGVYGVAADSMGALVCVTADSVQLDIEMSVDQALDLGQALLELAVVEVSERERS